MLWWLQSLYDICTTQQDDQWVRYLAGIANLSIAIAYYLIPFVMLVVFRKHRTDLAYPWLWTMFVSFIAACGTSHMVHVVHAFGNPRLTYSYLEVIILLITATVSLGTGLAFTLILPRILRIVSATAVRRQLEENVATATQALYEANQNLESALTNEKLLLREVHHRVKNNLQVINSLLMLHEKEVSLETRNPFKDLRNRVLAMGKIHDQLRVIGHTNTFNVEDFVKSTCRDLSIVYRKEGQVRCVVEVVDFPFGFEYATPLALLMNELISNAFKHAFPTNRAGTILITLQHQTNGDLLFSVQDDGVGMSKMIDTAGIGLRLIKASVSQLNAQLEWHELPTGGMLFQVHIPKLVSSGE